jgi:hypothetical protein
MKLNLNESEVNLNDLCNHTLIDEMQANTNQSISLHLGDLYKAKSRENLEDVRIHYPVQQSMNLPPLPERPPRPISRVSSKSSILSLSPTTSLKINDYTLHVFDQGSCEFEHVPDEEFSCFLSLNLLIFVFVYVIFLYFSIQVFNKIKENY